MGFTTLEQMSGTHAFHAQAGPPGEHPFTFRVRWGPESLRRWLRPGDPGFLRAPLRGEVRVGGLCEWTPCEGTIHLDYLGARRIRYTFDFEVDGVAYRFQGDKKNIRLWNLAVTHTTCFGVLTRRSDERLISTSVTFFRLRDLPRFVAAVRPAG